VILEYISLGILLMGLTLVFYGFIYIHDIPYMIAKKRDHPHKEAIHVACWLSLFTLHAIWPIVYIWAMIKQKPFEVALSGSAGVPAAEPELLQRLEKLEERLRKIESPATAPGKQDA
jgi:Na+/H+ antiporter NhaD/arsenite permease-like protein